MDRNTHIDIHARTETDRVIDHNLNTATNFVHPHTCAHTDTDIHVFTYAHTHAHTHTHTHTHTMSSG